MTRGRRDGQMKRHRYKTKHIHLVRQSLSLETPMENHPTRLGNS